MSRSTVTRHTEILAMKKSKKKKETMRSELCSFITHRYFLSPILYPDGLIADIPRRLCPTGRLFHVSGENPLSGSQSRLCRDLIRV